jgi:hypothetical protein
MKSVPKFNDHSLGENYAFAIAEYPDLQHYFPHYDEPKYAPPRGYFWNVFNTLYPDIVETHIQTYLLKKSRGVVLDNGTTSASIRADII